MRRVSLLLFLGFLLFAGCGEKHPAVGLIQTATAIATTTVPTQTPIAASPSSSAASAARLAAMNGLQCIGSWKNTASGSTGAFATRLEGGGFGGSLHFEVGGNAFGVSQGIVFDAPFKLVGNELEIDAQSESMGHMLVHIGLDGTAGGRLEAIPNLGPGSSATMSDYAFANNKLHFVLDIDPGDGRPAATAAVDAACSGT